MVDSYVVSWSSDQCPDYTDEGYTTITHGSIDDLRGGTSYSIIVSAINMAGTSSDNITVQTLQKSNVHE